MKCNYWTKDSELLRDRINVSHDFITQTGIFQSMLSRTAAPRGVNMLLEYTDMCYISLRRQKKLQSPNLLGS